MLVLTRRSNESILIGDDITVTILGVTPGGVRVGIDAPRGKRINRAELVLAVRDENQDAVQASADQAAESAVMDALGRFAVKATSSSSGS